MEYLQVFSLIFEFHRIGYTLILRLDHTQDFRVTDDQPAFRDGILRLNGRPGPHFIVNILTRETMHQVEPIAIDLQFQVGGSCPQICSYTLLYASAPGVCLSHSQSSP